MFKLYKSCGFYKFAYLSIKNNIETENKTTKEEAEKLYYYLKKQLEQTKRKF